MESEKDYYWLKLSEHFFTEDRVVYLMSQENGEKYVIFWIRLLLKCLKNKEKDDKNYGFLRFTDKIPYDDKLLSKIFNTDIDVVRAAIKYLCDLEMIEILPDQTIYIEEVQRLVGKRTTSTARVRKYREKRRLMLENKSMGETFHAVSCNANKEKEEEKEEEKEKEGETSLPLSFQQRICIAFSKEYNDRFLMYHAPREAHLQKALEIIRGSPNREKTTMDIIKVIPVFFEKPFWFNSVDGKKKEIDKSQLSLGNFLAHCLDIIASTRASPKKTAEGTGRIVCPRCGKRHDYSPAGENRKCMECIKEEIEEEREEL
jgi:predicted phage replisome organizer